MEWRHVCGASNRDASNAHLTRSNSAGNSAGFPKEKLNGRRKSRAEGNHEVAREPVSRSAEAMAKVGRGLQTGIQRDVQYDVAKPVDVSSSSPGKAQQEDVENDRVECGVDSGGRSQIKQRWSREAYNAYQREYMRKRRSA